MTTPSVFERLTGKIDRDSQSHLYQQVRNYLRDKIASRELMPGDVIPPHRKLSKLLDVSEITVRRAIQDLVKEGLLVSRAGSGTFVAQANGANHGRVPVLERPVRQGTRVGVVIASLTDGNPFISQFLAGVRSELGANAPLQVFELPFDPENAFDLAETAQLESVDGIILMSPLNIPLLARVQRSGMPYAILHNDLADGQSVCVTVDYYEGVLQAVSHLLERNHRRIALVTASDKRFSTGRLAAAYEMAKRHFELDLPEDFLVKAGYGEMVGYETTQQLLARDDRPDAIIFASDYQAKGGFNSIIEQGLKVPDDVAVIGVGNALRPMEAPLKLTTIDPHFQKIGRQAAHLILKQMRGEQVDQFRYQVIPELIIGETT